MRLQMIKDEYEDVKNRERHIKQEDINESKSISRQNSLKVMEI